MRETEKSGKKENEMCVRERERERERENGLGKLRKSIFKTISFKTNLQFKYTYLTTQLGLND